MWVLVGLAVLVLLLIAGRLALGRGKTPADFLDPTMRAEADSHRGLGGPYGGL
ncbi:hypothetical protein FB474_3621 [Oryzihumus leptocrescens]|uniref:Uncharacterized protein n=1 Tax=Oryzihumus leptocrescens TaxID=297536 RepID=A0A542Z931_9MICO|nr:hypothetical protein FB474_3621 [Oryzihumus leptocrescens]